MGPYVVGILVALIINLHRRKTRIFRIRNKANMFLWVISLSLINLTIFGLYPDAEGTHSWSRVVHILYQTFSKYAWSLSIGYIIYSCSTTFNQGLSSQILNWPFWTPLSRLSYPTFLIHAVVIMYYSSVQEHLAHLQHLNLVI
jgi:hypothetical protein